MLPPGKSLHCLSFDLTKTYIHVYINRTLFAHTKHHNHELIMRTLEHVLKRKKGGAEGAGAKHSKTE